MRKLTRRQESILAFLSEFIEKKGYPPTLREIGERFSIKSPKNARKHLDALEKKGFIQRTAARSRAIVVEGVTARASLPILGRVRAGEPNLAVEDVLGHITLDGRSLPEIKDAFLLKVQGESMKDASLEDGDLVIVKPGPEVLNGDIVVALIDGEATVKRFLKEGDTVILKPENPDFKPIEIREKDGRDFQIIGKAVMVMKSIGSSGGNFL